MRRAITGHGSSSPSSAVTKGGGRRQKREATKKVNCRGPGPGRPPTFLPSSSEEGGPFSLGLSGLWLSGFDLQQPRDRHPHRLRQFNVRSKGGRRSEELSICSGNSAAAASHADPAWSRPGEWRPSSGEESLQTTTNVLDDSREGKSGVPRVGTNTFNVVS